jgi:hypothetical protein
MRFTITININTIIIDKTSSRAQIAAYLLMILAMAERGGLKSPLVRRR